MNYKLQILNDELIKYFTERGWEAKIIFVHTNNFLNLNLLCASYFAASHNSLKKSNWVYAEDCVSIKKYTYWFFEHVKPFWIKYDIGNIKLYVENVNGNYVVNISNTGNITEITFPPHFHKP